MPKKRDLADILESVMIIEATSAYMPRPSSDAIEVKIGMVKQAKATEGRRLSSGRITKARRGDHRLELPTIQKLLDIDRQIWPECSPLIWELIRSGKLNPLTEAGCYSTLSASVRKLLPAPPERFGILRKGGDPHALTTPHHLRCLVAAGTLDTITALWMLLIQADAAGSDNVLLIASYIPPALAMFCRRPEGRRTAIFLFARMRQSILDRVQWGGQELSLCGYDLHAAATRAAFWPTPAVEIPHKPNLCNEPPRIKKLSPAELEAIDRLVQSARRSRFAKRVVHTGKVVTVDSLHERQPAHMARTEPPGLPNQLVEWIERERAPLRRAGSRPPNAAKWAYPARSPLTLANQPHPSGATWGKKAITLFNRELEAYLGADHETRVARTDGGRRGGRGERTNSTMKRVAGRKA